MFNLSSSEIILLSVYLLANGFLSLFQVFKDSKGEEFPIEYQNKAIKILTGISGLVIIVIFMVLLFTNWKLALFALVIGIIGQGTFRKLIHHLVVVPIHKVFYSRKK